MQWWILTIYTHITIFCSLACYFWIIIDGAAEEAFSVIIYVRLINSIAEQNFQKDYFDWLKYGHIYRVLSFLLFLHLTTCEAEAEPMCFSRRKLRHINQTPTHLLLALNEEGKRTLSLKARDTQTGNWFLGKVVVSLTHTMVPLSTLCLLPWTSIYFKLS